MTREILRNKEDLNEIDELKKQTEQNLKNLEQETIQPCINYLRLVIDKSYEKYTNVYSKDTITALQLLLKNKGYDVGNIDGILVTKGNKTSRTMEAIKRFQRDYHMEKVNGLPDKDTINTLLLLYELDNDKKKKEININKKKSESGYLLEANGLSVLTDKEAKSISQRNYADLNRVTSISDKVAKILGSGKVKDLELNGLTKLSDNQTEYLLLSGLVSMLELNGLTSLTNKQARLLSKVAYLKLNGLKKITKEQVIYLSSGEVKYLELDGLTGIDGLEKDLSKLTILSLNGLTRITKEQVIYLLSGEVKHLHLDGLTSIDGIEKDLSKLKTLKLNGLTSLTDKQVKLLTSGKVKYLELNGLINITDEQVKILANSKSSVESLIINKGILTPTQREILSKKIK